MPDHKTEDYKQSAVDYYLVGDNTQKKVCQIFKCYSPSKKVLKFKNFKVKHSFTSILLKLRLNYFVK